MNKSELVDALAAKTDVSKVAAAKSIDALVAIITETVASGSDVALVGFGSNGTYLSFFGWPCFCT